MLQLESLPQMVAMVNSNDAEQQLESTTQFRKLLSIGEFEDFVLSPVVTSVYMHMTLEGSTFRAALSFL